MSRFFPHPAYAEDQPYSRTLLTYHVLHRAFQSGAVIGTTISGVRRLTGRNPYLLLTTGRSALIATAVMTAILPVKMAGKADIEWKDRSWRLLENEGQKEVDDWSVGGTVAGALVAATRREGGAQVAKGRWMRIAGGAGLGNLVGVVGYMGWRYGVNGGVWPNKKTE